MRDWKDERVVHPAGNSSREITTKSVKVVPVSSSIHVSL